MFVTAVQTWRKCDLVDESFDFPRQHKHKAAQALSHTPKKGSLFHPLFPAVSLFCEIVSQLFENCRKHNLEMEEAMMEPEDRRKKCFGCTSLRTGAIIIGAFDIVLSTIAIVVSVVAMMNAQVSFCSSEYGFDYNAR